jgi:hypothetical protein
MESPLVVEKAATAQIKFVRHGFCFSEFAKQIMRARSATTRQKRTDP